MREAPTVLQGIYVTVIGMIIVFAALTLVMLAVMALDRIFRPAAESGPARTVSFPPKAPREGSISSEKPSVTATEQEIIAAIAVALALRLQETEGAAAPMPIQVISLRDEASLWAAVGRLG